VLSVLPVWACSRPEMYFIELRLWRPGRCGKTAVVLPVMLGIILRGHVAG
jgi:hypothetical protein